MKRSFFLTAVFALILINATGQNSQVLYFMNLPQNHLMNPSLKPTARLYIGFPGLTGINIHVANNFMNFSDVFADGLKISESTLPFLSADFNTEKFLNRLKDINYIEPQVSVQLISAGLTMDKYYFFLDVTDRVEANAVFPRDLIRLGFLGFYDFAGQTFDLSPLKADVRYYREIGIGFSEEVSQRLRIGVKGKLLFGIAAGSYRNDMLDLAINNNNTNILNADVSLQISGPVDVFLNPDHKIDDIRFNETKFENYNKVNRILANPRNAGFGLDIGAEYAINERITISGAITDFGFIRWKTDITNLKGKGAVNLKGINFADIQDGSATIDEMAQNLTDSVRSAMIFTNSDEPFTTLLPFGFTLAGKYNVTNFFSVGLLSYSRTVSRQLKEAFTLSANLNLRNILSTSLTYTLSNHSYDNLGAGIGVRSGFAQFYLLADRIPVNWSKAGVGNGYLRLPENWHTINVRFGINFLFGNKEAKKPNTSKTSGE